MAWLVVEIFGIIIGVICGVAASGAFNSDYRKVNPGLGWGVGIFATIILCLLLCLPFGVRIISPGKTAVRMAFGSFAGDPLPNGMHLVAPWVQIIRYPTSIQEYTMDHGDAEGQRKGDDSISVLCRDRLQMQIDCTVFYTPKVDKLNWIHANMGPNYMEGYLRPLIRKIIPEVFGEYDAMEVSTTGREAACKRAEQMLAPEFEKMGVTLTEVNLRHIQPPQTVLDAISLKLAAVETAKKAEFEAEGLVAKARGEAEANKLRQVTITPMLIQWEQIQALKTLSGSGTKVVVIPMGSENRLLLQP